MSHQILLLSSENGPRLRDLLEVARTAADRNVRLASTREEFETGLISSPANCVILYDLDGFHVPAADVLALANQSGVPLLVISNNFDSEQWISLFRLGARDVLRPPLSAADLRQAMRSARSTNSQSATLELQDPWYIRTLQWARNTFRL